MNCMSEQTDERPLKQRIWDRYQKNRSTDFHLHNELLALCCCRESLEERGDVEEYGFEEVIFAVEKDWLITHLNRTTNEYWTADKVKKWLKTEYTSDDSAVIFEEAISQRAVMMLEFN